MSKTTANLQEAFAGESQARNQYTFFAKAARKEGFHYIAKIFEETALNEMRHAKDHFVLLGKLNSTEENLKEAAAGEDFETTEMYPKFEKEAEEEGNAEAAKLFKTIGAVEAHHRDRYLRLYEMVKNGTVFKRESPIAWRCSVCGYSAEGTEPPHKCPCCKHDRTYYEPANMDV